MAEPIQELCWFCKHFLYSQAEPGYGEYTPGSDFGMLCRKFHWTFDPFKTSQAEFAKILSSAATCKDFVLVESVRLQRERKERGHGE